MNKKKITAKDNFPLLSDTMEMMQQMIGLSANMALLGVPNYILSGCVDDDNGNISTGLVVKNGEILPFEAGTKKAKITIQQTSKTMTAFSVEYPELAYSLGKETEQCFTLPDLRRRFIVGYDNAFDSGYSQMWDTGGSETVTPEQMSIHSYDIEFVEEKWGDNANSRPFTNPAGTSGYTAQTISAGGGQAHKNRSSYYVLACVIKVK